jgi:hypothetical protein
MQERRDNKMETIPRMGSPTPFHTVVCVKVYTFVFSRDRIFWVSRKKCLKSERVLAYGLTDSSDFGTILGASFHRKRYIAVPKSLGLRELLCWHRAHTTCLSFFASNLALFSLEIIRAIEAVAHTLAFRRRIVTFKLHRKLGFRLLSL